MKKMLLVFVCMLGVLYTGYARVQNPGQDQARPPRPVPGQMPGSDISVHDPVHSSL